MMGRGIYFPFAVPVALVVVAIFFGNKDNSIEIAGEFYTVRPLKLALWFLVLDAVVFTAMWATGVFPY